MESVSPQPAGPTGELPTGELLTLVQNIVLISEVPPGSALTAAQSAGDQCMWCTVTDPAALNRVEGMGTWWPPRTCAPCLSARIAKVHTYLLWAWHTEECEPCTDGRRCGAAIPLGEAHANALETATGSRRVVCVRCHQPDDVLAQGLRPHRWLGEAAAYHSYQHGLKCLRVGEGFMRVL
ncbi:hypothetical protein [Streptomyces eurythermus]